MVITCNSKKEKYFVLMRVHSIFFVPLSQLTFFVSKEGNFLWKKTILRNPSALDKIVTDPFKR